MPHKNVLTDVFKYIDMKNGDKEQCWLWTGKVNKKDQRPYITIDGKRRTAYSVVLELHSGERPKKLMATHSCDDQICCNPYHLSWNTHQKNMNDMKDRERHGIPKTVVRAIRKLRSEGKSQQSIADLYGISRETVSAIDTGRSKRD